MTDSEKWEAYDLAKNSLRILISYYSKIIFEEERKASPDMEKIALWENEQHALMVLMQELNVEDQVGIANIRAKYAPIAHATLQNTSTTFQKT